MGRVIRRAAPAAAIFCIHILFGSAAQADDADICDEETDPALVIPACTKVIDAAATRDADLAWAFRNRGLGYADSGDRRRAIEDYTAALNLDPAYRSAFYNRGLTYFDLAEFDLALADLDRAEALEPDNPNTFHVRGMVLVGVNRDAEALVQFDRAIALEDDEKFYHNGRAVALTELGRCEDALKAVEAALDIDRSYGNAVVNRGVALACLGRRDAAMEEFGVAMGLDKNSGSIFNAIAWKLAKSDKMGFRGDEFPLQMAMFAVDRADVHGFRDTLAAALANAGRFDEAVIEEKRALDMARAAGETAYEAQYLRRLALYEKGEMLSE